MPVIANETCTCPAACKELCGKDFDVSDSTRLHAVFDLDNTAVGVTVDCRDASVSLVFHPAVQVPVGLCEGFTRFCFEHDDPQMVEIALDEKDGEVRLIKHVPARKQDIEAAIREYLAFFDATAYPAILAYLKQRFEEKYR